MKLTVLSLRGDHSAVVEEEVGRQVFNKLTGRRDEALSTSLKTRMPDNWAELEMLFKDGRLNYKAAAQKEKEFEMVTNFDPKIEEMIFIPPVTGG